MTGPDLRTIRLRLGLTQAQLAKRLCITPNSLARQERGEIGIRESVAELARRIQEEEK